MKKANHEEIKRIVKEIVHEWDPYSLLAGGAPIDEFDGEIASIVNQHDRIHGIKDAVHVISRVFSSSFESDQFKIEHCQDVGEKLFSRLAAANLIEAK